MQHRFRKCLRSLPRLERLETRQLLAVDSLVISEFMADNDAVLADEDGEFSDWIEVHNASDEAVSLLGWSLTDQVDEPMKWSFPDVSLSAGGYQLVFASGKNRSVVDGELHTSFRLSASGEYLALVGPDGVAHEFAEEYPRQRSDVSFGLTIPQTLLSSVDATSRIQVPTIDNAALDWTSPEFDDAQWTQATGAVGFDEREGLPNVGFEEGDFNHWEAKGPAAIVDAEIAIPTQGVRQARLVASDAGSQRFTIETLVGLDRSSLDQFCGCRATLGAAVSREIEVEAGSVLQFDWNLLTNEPSVNGSPDFAFASITPSIGLIPLASVADVDRLSTSGFGRETGYRKFEYTFEEGGTYTLGVGVMNAADRFDDSGVLIDNLLVDGIGSISDTFEGLIESDVSGELSNVDSSIRQRYTFDIADKDEFTALILRANYDDGMVVYLNGHEVAVRNAPQAVEWNSKSLNSRPDSLGLSPENITISTEHLVAGTNVLALQGLKESVGDETFLLRAELVGVGEIELSSAYMPTPTPGQANLTTSFNVVDEVQFSSDHGFANQAFDLTMTTATPDAEIRYTIDGSVPTSDSSLYDSPITIGTSTVVRAAAFKEGLETSTVATQSYLFIEDVITQSQASALDRGFPRTWAQQPATDYEMDQRIIGQNGTDRYRGRYAETVRDDLLAIPTLSLVMEMDDLFGPRGIYTNPFERGIDWERPTSIELIHPNGDEGFQIDAGIRIQGGISRFISSKSSLRLLFKEQYGDAKLDYPLFGEENPSEFDSISLRSSSGEHLVGIHYIRDEFLRRSQLRTGNISSHGTYMHLFLNGLYWGMYNPVERIDSQFAANHYGGDKDEYDVLNAGDLGAEGISAVDGTIDTWNTLVDMTRELERARTEEDRNAAYLRLKGLNPDGTRNDDWEVYLDTDNYIDYLITNVYARNGDWPIRNYYMARRRGLDSTGFKFFVWDAEFTLDVDVRGRDSIMSVTSDGPGILFPFLLQSELFRVEFGDRVQEHFTPGGAYYVNPNNRQYDPDNPQDNEPAALYAEIAAEVASPLVPESARWGNERARNGTVFTRDEQWLPTVNFNLSSFFPNRSRDFLLDLIRNDFYREPPQFSVASGPVDAGQTLELTGTGTIYYTLDGSDPRNADGTLADSAIEYAGPLAIDSRLQVRTRGLDAGRWSAIDTADYFTDTLPADESNLRISEINFNPHDPILTLGEENVDNDQFEFIELVNIGNRPVELNAVEFVQRDSEGIVFTFGDQTLAPDEYLVVPKNRSAFISRFGSDVPLAVGLGDDPDQWTYEGRLGNGGERITLVDPAGKTIQSLEYDDSSEWPGRSDGNGSALEIIDIEGDVSDPENYRSSSEFGGSPGVLGAGPDNRVVINEVLANTDFPDVDTIEFFNTSLTPIDLSGWYLSDSNNDYLRYRIPDGTAIDPGAYLVMDERQFVFGLNSVRGDDVFLIQSDADGRPIRFVDRVEFDASEPGVSFGRWPNGEGRLFPMSSTTFGAVNAGPLVSPVIISEVHYEPEDPDDEGELTESNVEFVEIHNWTDQTVDLSSYQLDGGIEFRFANDTQLAAGESIVVLPFDPVSDPGTASLIRLIYRMDNDVPLAGPWTGQLDNDSGVVELRRDVPNPLVPDETPTVLADRVSYENSSPWPDDLNATGQSLTRIAVEAFGGFVTSWTSESRSPGETNFSQVIPGDVTLDGRVDVDDIDGVCQAVNDGRVDARFDLDKDGEITQADLQFLLSEIMDISPGDADLNGVFNSSDLVQIFRTAEYEDAVADNSTWSDGDWDCDRDFTSSDLVLAFRTGAYSTASTPVARASKLPTPLVHDRALAEPEDQPRPIRSVEEVERVQLRARNDLLRPSTALQDVFDTDNLRRREHGEVRPSEVDSDAVDRFFEHEAL